MVDFLINKPIAVIMAFLACLFLGIVAVDNIPVSSVPDISIPEITVHINRSNTSNRDLENTIVSNLRTQLLQVPHIEDIHSETRDGYAVLRLRFKFGTNIDYAFIETNEKIDRAMNTLPRDMERPRVNKASTSDIPVFYINLSLKQANLSSNSESFIKLSDFAKQVIKRRLEQTEEIAFADITGLSYSEVYIIPDQGAMAALHLTTDDFKRIIESNNLLYGNVQAMDGVLQYNIRFITNKPISVEDVKNVIFKQDDRVFKLKEIASIGVRAQRDRGVFISHNNPSVNLAIIKQSDVKMDDLRKKVKSLLARFERDYPNIRFEQTQDQTELLDQSISNLKQDLFIGSFLAFILMFFFLKNIRAPLLIGVTIPVCLILSILFFNLFHLSINIISLSGLVLSVGLMIDNSIIVIDNITQHREQGMSLNEACVKGTTKIIRPLLTSVLTTCSVFIPLIFLSGIAGALFFDQAMAITIGLSVSFIVSVTLLPTLYKLIHKGAVHKIEGDFFEKFGIDFFEKLYEAGFRWVFNNKISAVLIVIVLIALNFILFSNIRKEKLPAVKQTEFVAEIDWNSNVNITENTSRITGLIEMLENDLLQSNAMIGQQQYLLNKNKELSASEAHIYVKAATSVLLEKVKKKLERTVRLKYPIASIKISPPPNVFEKIFGDDEPDLVLHLVKKQDGSLPDISDVVKTIAKIEKTHPGIAITQPVTQNTLALSIDADKLALYDLSLDAIYNKLKAKLYESEVGVIRNGQTQVPIIVSEKNNNLESVLSHLTVLNKKGIEVPISGLLKLQARDEYKTIDGGGKGNYIPLNIQTDHAKAVMKSIKKEIILHTNLEGAFSGSYFSNQKLITEMSIVLLVAVLLLYFILAAQFESLVQPLIVLVELPISMSGALIMLYIFHSSVNLISLIGLVVMCGIIINDSILKIDTVNQLRRHDGYGLMDAIHTAGKRRLKSIIMTALTTILSVAPFLFGNDLGSVLQRPLSLALIGGMAIGTPVSLYFIPLVYWFYYRNSEKTVA